MSGGFFRGTSADQDTRFSNKQAKLLKSQKFASELDHLVDMRKVKMDVIRPWIANRVTELLGFEDEVLINFIYGLLDGKEVNGKEVQISLTGFMEKNTGKFMKELWTLLLSAQNNESGVPQQFLDAKEEETRRKQAEVDRITNEIQKKKEMESREIEQERSKKMDGGVESKAYNAVKELDSKHILSKGITGNPEVDKSDNGNGVRGRNSTSPPHIGKSLSNSRSYSGDRQKSRSVSRSPVTRGRSISSDRKYRSPRERSNTPRRKHSPHSPPRKRSSYPRHRSRSPSRRRSPSLVLRRNRSPYKRRSPSPVRRRLSSPSRRRRSPSLIHRRRSPSPMHRRSRSPMRSKSPLPVRRRSPLSPRRRLPSPLRRKYHRSPSTPRKWSLSPIRHKSPRPARRRTLVASRRRSPSPYGSSSPSPIWRRSPSPIPTRRRSPAPSRVRSPSPYRSVSPPHTRRRSPAPIPLRRRSPAPSRHRSPSPYGSGSPSHTRRRSPSPIPPHRRSPAPSRLRSPSPIPPRRRSPVPSRLRSPSPYASSSPSARRNSLSPVRKRSSRSLVQSPAQRRTQGKKSPVRRQPSRSLTPPRRDRKDLRSEVKALLPSPKRSPIRSASPSLTRNRSPGEHRRSSSSYESPVRHIKGRVIDDASISLQKPREGKQHHRSPGINRDDKEIGYAWGEGGDPKPSSLQKRSENSSTIIKQKDLSAKVDYKDGQSREKLSGRMTIDSQNHPDKMESRKKDQETKSEKSSGRGSYLENLDRKGSPASYKLSYRQRQSYAGEESDEQNHSQLNNIKDSDKGDKSGTGPVLVGKVDHDDGGNVCVSGSEESDKHRTEIKEKRKHKKRSHRRDVTSDDDYSYDSEIEDRKEAKRRRKEEKKLRKEEKRRRREERRRRKEERREEKLKLKDQNHSSSSDDEHRGGRRGSNLIDDEETPAEQQKLEIELRQKALESLKAKKGINY